MPISPDPMLLERLRSQPNGLHALQRGIEKESLRVAANGELSRADHPRELGAALTHPHITTDFSEAQLELITDVHPTPEACLQQLESVHRFVYHNLGDELLWPASMPCRVGEDPQIPVGRYGTSNVGRAKTVYRLGLGLRYGRLMQTISGIHYNFSLPQQTWHALGYADQDAQDQAYFALIRNFRRWSWLLIYLFGASPAVCRSFTRGLAHNLVAMDEGSQYLPDATSLRMGPLGYQSSAQSALHVSYNSLEEYATSMVQALTTVYAPYAQHGTQDTNGDYLQLNTNILQIENEFYGSIRPKRRTEPGDRPVSALRARGVEYVEVRCLDLNPFLPLGIDAQQIRFLDTFLLLCLICDSAPDNVGESGEIGSNQHAVVERGRSANLPLQIQGQQVNAADYALALLDACREVVALLDAANQTDLYGRALQAQVAKVTTPSLTPSARVLDSMREQQQPFFSLTMQQARAFKQAFANHPLTNAELADMQAQARDSLRRQNELETTESLSFADYLEEYLAIPG
ncbi:MAG: glutamate--cysteine ligase [Pseudomonadota bacterium]